MLMAFPLTPSSRTSFTRDDLFEPNMEGRPPADEMEVENRVAEEDKHLDRLTMELELPTCVMVLGRAKIVKKKFKFAYRAKVCILLQSMGAHVHNAMLSSWMQLENRSLSMSRYVVFILFYCSRLLHHSFDWVSLTASRYWRW